MWAHFAEAGAGRLLLCRVFETRSLLDPIRTAVPGADITVVRLRAPLNVLQARIRSQEAGRDPQWYLDPTTDLINKLEQTGVDDHVVDNHDRPIADGSRGAPRDRMATTTQRTPHTQDPNLTVQRIRRTPQTAEIHRGSQPDRSRSVPGFNVSPRVEHIPLGMSAFVGEEPVVEAVAATSAAGAPQ
ncbi:MAG TPA: hypothetical protein VGX25_19160 [Actinophytocola sp.]|uniref:hypothetical protein n=1 Tax=Actinophytocola sp. TaxID=1872138 RepID=UPI002DDD7460|nr:hypothetical protein [Actinophytocola sp.]HEV2781507.1 hypothetical protein [Actinophytocola sp.]